MQTGPAARLKGVYPRVRGTGTTKARRRGATCAQNSAGKNRVRWPTLVVAMIVSGSFSDSAWAMRMISASMVLSPAVGWPVCRASAHSSAARRMIGVVIASSANQVRR